MIGEYEPFERTAALGLRLPTHIIRRVQRTMAAIVKFCAGRSFSMDRQTAGVPSIDDRPIRASSIRASCPPSLTAPFLTPKALLSRAGPPPSPPRCFMRNNMVSFLSHFRAIRAWPTHHRASVMPSVLQRKFIIVD